MNTIVTSREAILAESRRIVMEQGIGAINMRIVAAACNVAVGSIYNYFPSKADLIYASVEDVWKDIFHMEENEASYKDFTECLIWVCESIRNGCRKYPGFFTLHSMSFTAGSKEKGRQLMESYFIHIKGCLIHVLKKDSMVREDAFNETLTPENFVDLIFTMLLSQLLQGKQEDKALVQMVKNCIY